ncbi:MAG TPA: hypothetical protein VK427_17440 [Kofleriaceae bacterium]|nr:hypothetical protein [Kofleriaceae bacterium]
MLALGAGCSTDGARSEDQVTQQNQPRFDQAAARAKLDAIIASSTFLRDDWVGPVPELDAGGMYAFSAMPPSTGKAGEVLFWIGPDETLSTAQATRDFDRLMAKLGVGARVDAVEVHRLAALFVRFRVMRRGVVLDRPDGHALLKPDRIPADRFTPPRLSTDASGAHLTFWLFDTDRMEPVSYRVDIAPDGKTTFTEG